LSSLGQTLGYIFFSALLVFMIWHLRRLKLKAARLNKTEEFERAKARSAAVVYPSIGLFLIGMILFNRRSVPEGNEPVGFFMIGLGVVSILYGLYKLYRLRRFR
jgi:hypothetical protein